MTTDAGPTPSEQLIKLFTKTLKGHRTDSMSQDSGNHCECGSDSRFEQRGGDHPWKSIDEHRAQMIVAMIEGQDG